MTPSRGRVLIIAGSDSGGGAGVQADVKTVTALGGYAATAITAVTVQDTNHVYDVHPVPLGVIAEQIRVVLHDIGADAIKIGMLGATAVVATVAEAIETYGAGIPVVVDPVMVAKGGEPLLPDNAVEAVERELAPRAALVTPNAPEASRITGLPVETPDELAAAGAAMVEEGAAAVLVKGGHLPGPEVTDVLVAADGVERRWRDPRIESRSTHGTGCTLASAIATGLAQGLELEPAITRARQYLRTAIERAPDLGRGHGPVDHGWPLRA